MTVLVHVWKPFGWKPRSIVKGENRAVGHAAITLEGSHSAYMSWWPNDQARNSLVGNIQAGTWGVRASNHLDINQDIREEYGHLPETIDLTGLNEADIYNWWMKLKKTHWSLLNTNCSQIAIDALRAGGADKYIQGNLVTRTYVMYSLVWRPNVVLDYARAVKRGLDGSK